MPQSLPQDRHVETEKLSAQVSATCAAAACSEGPVVSNTLHDWRFQLQSIAKVSSNQYIMWQCTDMDMPVKLSERALECSAKLLV